MVMSEPMYRTRVVYTVVTAKEAFNGSPKDMADFIASGDAVLIETYRETPQEMTAEDVLWALAAAQERSE